MDEYLFDLHSSCSALFIPDWDPDDSTCGDGEVLTEDPYDGVRNRAPLW